MADEKRRDPFTLFELTDEINVIVTDIIDAEIEGDEDEVQALIEELDDLHEKRGRKHEAYVHVIKNALASAKPCRAEAEAFTKRARALENLAKRLKKILLDDLREHDEESINAGIFKIARQANAQTSVIISVDAEELPEKFQLLKPEPNKDAIRVALLAGEEIDGAALGDAEHIRIRVL